MRVSINFSAVKPKGDSTMGYLKGSRLPSPKIRPPTKQPQLNESPADTLADADSQDQLLTPNTVLALQRKVGNQAVQRLLQRQRQQTNPLVSPTLRTQTKTIQRIQIGG